MPDGSIVLVEIAARRLTRVQVDGSKSTIVELQGGPNGAAIGPDGRCYICNNGGMNFIERDGMLIPAPAGAGINMPSRSMKFMPPLLQI